MLSGEKPVHHYYTCDFFVGAERVRATKVLSIDIERQYMEIFADKVTLEVVIGLGTFTSRLYPNKEKLTAVIYRSPIGEAATVSEYYDSISSTVYNAVLLDSGDYAGEGNHPVVNDPGAADLTNLINVKFQLVEQRVEHLRLKTVGCVARKVTVGSTIRSIVTQVSKSLPLDIEEGVKGLDMVEPENKEVRDHIVIPHGTRLVDLPHFLQSEVGVYSSGLGFYLQGGIWYLYPEYNLTRFSSSPKGLTVINIPPNKLPGMERTYRKTNNQVIVVSTGQVKHADPSEALQLNAGNGSRFSDSKRLFEGFGKTENNRTTLSRAKNANEFKARQRDTELNNVQVSSTRFNNNIFKESSQLAAREGSYINLVWEHSEPGLIYPGMPVKLLYLKNDEVKEVEGVVAGAHHYIHQTTPGITTRRHICNTVLSLYVKREFYKT
jgi:hypothetical protein